MRVRVRVRVRVRDSAQELSDCLSDVDFLQSSPLLHSPSGLFMGLSDAAGFGVEYAAFKDVLDIMEREGHNDFSVYRPPNLWASEVLSLVRQAGRLVTSVPMVPQRIAQLLKQRLLFFQSQSSVAELANMSSLERKLSFFARLCVPIGEAFQASLDDEEFIQIRFTSDVKEGLWNTEGDQTFATIAVSSCLTSAAQINDFFEKIEPEISFAYAVTGSDLAIQCDGKNLSGQTIDEWLLTAARVQAIPAQHSSDGGLKKLLTDMASLNDANGAPRDVFREAQMVADTVFYDRMARADKRDPRPPLSSLAIQDGLTRCPRHCCSGILQKFDTDCPICHVWSIENCVCKNCRTSFDPNERTSCAVCYAVFPHAGSRYDQWLLRQAMSNNRSADVDLTDGDVSKSTDRKKIQRKEDDAVVAKILTDHRGTVDARVMHVRSAATLLHQLIKVSSTAAQDSLRQQPPIEGLTCGLTFDMLYSISRGSYGSPGKGLSVWQCLSVFHQPWSSDRYFNAASDSEKKLTKTQLDKLRFDVQLSFAMEAIRNMALLLMKWGNSKWAEWVEQSGSILEMYHNSLEAQVRISTFTPAFMLDIIDRNNDVCSSYLRELVCLSKTNSNATSVALLQRQFPDLQIDADNVNLAPFFNVRHLCPRHEQTVSAHNWPEEAFDCACRWHPIMRRYLREFKAAPIKLPQGTVRIGQAVGGGAITDDDEAGGERDKLSTVLDNKMPFPVFNGSSTVKFDADDSGPLKTVRDTISSKNLDRLLRQQQQLQPLRQRRSHRVHGLLENQKYSLIISPTTTPSETIGLSK